MDGGFQEHLKNVRKLKILCVYDTECFHERAQQVATYSIAKNIGGRWCVP